MYRVPKFREPDEQRVLQFIYDHPFALVSGCMSGGRPVATQLPLLLEERAGKRFLIGHLMRHTDHHRAFLENPQVLCLFSGAQAYISASWYSDPHQASTWNYMSAHLRGRMQFLDDAGLIDVLRKTSLHFENGNRSSPTVYDNLPEEYTSKLLGAIAAFEIEVEEMDHIFKLSQNRNSDDFNRIIAALENGREDARKLAVEMKRLVR